MMHHGSADALRVSQKALPTEGTWGLVAWPYGDSRNGIWLGAVYTQQNDALLNTSPDVDYEAHPSGAYTLLDQKGNFTFAFPDGSALQVGATGGAPTLTRHVVNAQQVQGAIAYPNSTRMAAAPTPFPTQFTHASGTTVTVDAAGNANVTAVSGTAITLKIAGGVSLVMSGTNVAITGTLTVTGGITAGYGSGDSVTVQQHTHTQPDDSLGATEAVTNAPTAGT
jgi:phage baseplate assembly protein gpV